MPKWASGASWLISGGPARGPTATKGWVLVCELVPGRHDIEIAVAVDKEAIREPFYINDATSATSSQTRPMIMKITAGESGDE
jgi:hypothetical protein